MKLFYQLILLPIIFLSYPLYSKAQKIYKVEDVRKMLQSVNTDTGKVTGTIRLSYAYLNKPGELKNDLDSAMYLALNAKKAAELLHFAKGIGESILLQAQIYRELGDNKKALKYTQQANAYFIKHAMPKQQADAQLGFNALLSIDDHLSEKITFLENAVKLYHQANALTDEAITLQNLGDYYTFKAEWGTCIKLFERSLAIFDRIKYKDKQGVYSLLNTSYTQTGSRLRALHYGLLALKTAKDVQDTSMQLCTIYNRLGITYDYLQKYDQALDNLEKGLKIANHYHDKNAIFNMKLSIVSVSRKLKKFSKALHVLKELASTSSSTYLYDNEELVSSFAQIYMDLKQYGKAKYYIDAVTRLQKNDPYTRKLSKQWFTAAMRYFLLTKQYPQLYEQLAIGDSCLQLKPNLYYNVQVQRYWAKADSATGRMYSALRYYQKYKSLSDSFNNQNQAKQLAEMQLEYDMDTKNKQVKLLQQQGELQKTRIKSETNLRYVFIGGIVILMIFAGLMYNRSRIRVIHNKELTVKQREINNKNNQLETLLNEKEWLLKEIHHRVKNNLQIVISLLNTQSSFLENEDAVSAIRHSQQRMFAISLIHQKLYQSENLSTIDMPPYIMELIEFLKESFESEKRIDFRQDFEPLMLDVVQAVPLGLIMNEAICNAVKYAFTEKSLGIVTITLKSEKNDCYQLCINDNGIGLPPDFEPGESGSLGMNLMYGLAEQLNADIQLISKNGVSVCVTFKINFNNPLTAEYA